MFTDLGENKTLRKNAIKFEETVHESPEEVGIDAPALVQQYLDETDYVEYSLPNCWRLLEIAGLSYQ